MYTMYCNMAKKKIMISFEDHIVKSFICIWEIMYSITQAQSCPAIPQCRCQNLEHLCVHYIVLDLSQSNPKHSWRHCILKDFAGTKSHEAWITLLYCSSPPSATKASHHGPHQTDHVRAGAAGPILPGRSITNHWVRPNKTLAQNSLLF